MDLVKQWRDALADLVVRHPNRASRVSIEVDDRANLRIALDQTRDSRDPEVVLSPFVISNVKLTFFPGVKIARAWLAAAFAGYVQHEALELVTVGDLTTRPLDPHEPPFTFDRGLRKGLPVELTPETLVESLAVVMGHEAAEAYALG